MRTLAEALISVFELLEAEGRVLKTRIALLAFVVAMFFVAGAFMFLGLLMLAWGLYEYLIPRMGKTASLAAVGAGAILFASAIFAGGFGMIGGAGRGNSHEKSERPSVPAGSKKTSEGFVLQGKSSKID